MVIGIVTVSLAGLFVVIGIVMVSLARFILGVRYDDGIFSKVYSW